MAKSIKGTQTEKNLLKAFAGESQARNRYEFFMRVAQKEGYEIIAAIFQETANQIPENLSRTFKIYHHDHQIISNAFISPHNACFRPAAVMLRG